MRDATPVLEKAAGQEHHEDGGAKEQDHEVEDPRHGMCRVSQTHHLQTLLDAELFFLHEVADDV